MCVREPAKNSRSLTTGSRRPVETVGEGVRVDRRSVEQAEDAVRGFFVPPEWGRVWTLTMLVAAIPRRWRVEMCGARVPGRISWVVLQQTASSLRASKIVT